MQEEAKFKIGDSIRVATNYHWAKNATGKISMYPFDFEDEKWIDNYFRYVQTNKRKKYFTG